MPRRTTSKEAILVQSIRAIRRIGYHRTSIGDLSKIIGIPKSHFYYYFENKAKLMEEVLVSVHQYFQQKIFSIPQDPALDPRERYKKFCNKLLKINSGDQGGCLMTNTLLDINHTKEEEQFAPLIQAYFEDLQSCIQELIEGFGIPKDVSSQMAERALKEIQGSILMAQVYKDSSILEKTCTDLLFQIDSFKK